MNVYVRQIYAKFGTISSTLKKTVASRAARAFFFKNVSCILRYQILLHFVYAARISPVGVVVSVRTSQTFEPGSSLARGGYFINLARTI